MYLTTGSVGPLVKDARQALSLTQQELAQRAGCSQRLISELENGKEGIAFNKVMSVMAALSIQLEAKVGAIDDPAAEIRKLEQNVVSQIKQKRTRRLADYLEDAQ